MTVSALIFSAALRPSCNLWLERFTTTSCVKAFSRRNRFGSYCREGKQLAESRATHLACRGCSGGERRAAIRASRALRQLAGAAVDGGIVWGIAGADSGQSGGDGGSY